MSTKPKLKLAAIKIGEALKYVTSVNEIDKIACGTFPFQRENFPSEGITSLRAQHLYEWIMTLFKQKYSDNEKLEYLQTFLTSLVPDNNRNEINRILSDCGIHVSLEQTGEKEFDSRNYHREVINHSRSLFLKGEYFHAVFEAAKAYNAKVKQKSGFSNHDGQALMNKAFSSQTPIIKLTPCLTETEKNIQDGYRFLAAGLMSAIRNPTAHEPALSFPIEKEDALDILSLISYLFRRLDKAKFEDKS